MSSTITFFCACMSFKCQEQIIVSMDEAMTHQGVPYTWIADTCKHGPEPTDVLVEEREGFKIYKEVK